MAEAAATPAAASAAVAAPGVAATTTLAVAEDGGDGAADDDLDDDAPVLVDPSTLPKFSLGLLAFIKAAQLQNGLRHTNYLKYRRYCANRLKTLRRRVKFSHRAPKIHPSSEALPKTKKGKRHKGGAHTFAPRHLELDFEDLQYPQLALVNAERAWAYAMQLKQDSESVDNPRLRFHSLQRLRKAVYWSRKLAAMAAVRGDERTSLECDAYAAWLAGSAEMESDNWQLALEHFVKTRTIYKQLLQVSSVVEQDLFARRMEEVSTQIEFIQYKIELNPDQGSSAGEHTTAVKGGGGRLLQSKLEGVLEEERVKNSSTLSRVEWCGHHIPVDNDRVRLAVLRAKDTATKLAQLLAREDADPESEEFEDVYFDLMARYDDAQQLVDRDIANVSKVTLKADEVKLQMGLLRSYIKSCKLDHTVRKNTAMIRVYAERWRQQQRGFGSAGATAGAGAGAARVVRTTDMVKLHDTLLQNIADAQALQGASNDMAYQNRHRFKHGAFSAARCYYIAEAFYGRGDYTTACALYDRGLQSRKELLATDNSAADAEDKALVVALGVKFEGGRCRCLARSVLDSQPAGAAAADGAAGGLDADTDLLARRGEFRKTSARGPLLPFSIAPIPPHAEAVPSKPLFFDLVLDEIPVPSTAHLAAADAAFPAKRGGGAAGASTAAAGASPPAAGGGTSSRAAAAPAGGGSADSDSDFESVEGSDSDSDSDDDGASGVPAAAASGGGGGLLGAARKWFGK